MSLRSNSNRKNQIIYEDKVSPKGVQYKEPYQIGKLLGKGGFATCFEITPTKDDKKYAVKIIPIQSNKPDNMEKIKTEIKIISGLNHPGVVRYINSFSDNESIYILLELCVNGSLGDVLKKRKHITEPEARFVVYQMVEIIQYIKSKRIIHRDIKLANIFLDEHFRLKLGDFGLATLDDEEFRKKKSVCGTPNYIAPEVIEKKAYSYEIDVWSTGVLIFTLMHGVAPFETKSCKQTYERIRKGSFKFDGNKNINVSKDAKSFIRQILQIDPQKRLKIEQFMSHPFMQNYKIPQEVEPSFGTSSPSNAFIKRYSGTSNIKKQTVVVKKEPSFPKQQFQKTMTSEISLVTKKNQMKYCNLRNRQNYFSASSKNNPQLEMIKIEIQDNQSEKSLNRQQSCLLPLIQETPKKIKLKQEQDVQSNRIKKKFRPNFQIIEELSSQKMKGYFSISPSNQTPHKMSLVQPSSILQTSPNIDKSTRSMITITKTMVNVIPSQNQPFSNKLLSKPITNEIQQSDIMLSIFTSINKQINTNPSLIANRARSQLKQAPFKLHFNNRQKRIQQMENNQVKVLVWLDKWTQYGLAFLLSNKNTGIIFNDHSKMLMTRDKKIHYFQIYNTGLSKGQTYLECKDQALLIKRAQYLHEAQRELRCKNPCKSNKDDTPNNLQTDITYIRSYFKDQGLIMFLLSNNNLHCFFIDNSSIFVEISYSFVVFYHNYPQSDRKQFCSIPVINAKKISDQLKAKLTTVVSLYQKYCLANIQSKELASIFGKLGNHNVSGKIDARKA